MMNTEYLINCLNDWALGIHPVYSHNKFQEFVLEYLSTAQQNHESEDYICLSKQKSFYHAVYFLRRQYAGFIKDERNLDHYYEGALIPNDIRLQLETDYESDWHTYDEEKFNQISNCLIDEFD